MSVLDEHSMARSEAAELMGDEVGDVMYALCVARVTEGDFYQEMKDAVQDWCYAWAKRFSEGEK